MKPQPPWFKQQCKQTDKVVKAWKKKQEKAGA